MASPPAQVLVQREPSQQASGQPQPENEQALLPLRSLLRA
jgi:hypothetical protein